VRKLSELHNDSSSLSQCLQLVDPGLDGPSFSYISVPHHDSHAQDVHTALEHASAVVLARPIPDPGAMCPMSAPPSSTTGLTVCSMCGVPANPGPPSPAKLHISGTVDVDDCCDGHAQQTGGEAKGQPTGIALARPQQRPQQHTKIDALMQKRALQLLAGHASSSPSDSISADTPLEDVQQAVAQMGPRSRRRFMTRVATNTRTEAVTGGSHGTQAETAWYGLVVQQARRESGAFALKVSRTREPGGCSCTHFTLTPVCSGQPLYQQLQDAWLAL